jgi:lipid-binding SYLF domain-containing protein
MDTPVRNVNVPRVSWRLLAVLVALAGLLAAASQAQAQTKERRRLEACHEVLQELLAGQESIPRDLLDKAECVAVIPSAKKFALGWGGRFGKGAVVCRRASGRGWGAPLMITLGGGSWGAQIGVQAADYVFLIMNDKGIDHLLGSNFTLGADAAVAAGPVGRSGSAATDISMNAEILSYSRTRGLFAGVSLEGAMVKQDGDGNENVYGERVDARTVLLSDTFAVPRAAQPLVDLLSSSSPRHVAR